MRNFQKCTKSHEELSKIHKIPRGTAKYAQNPMRKFQNAQNPTKNFQKYPTRNIQ
jgi:hypothetical protein